jgi:uncharacterized protein YegL
MRVKPSNPANAIQPEVAAATTKPTVHNVHILDASGSMAGSKYHNAVEGVLTEIDAIRKDKTVNYTQTTVEFDDGWHAERITEHNFLTPIAEVKDFRPVGANGGTPLYLVVGIILTKLRNSVPKGDKVLVKIFTDGGDTRNGRGQFNANKVKKLIDELKDEGFTVTFVGTQQDIDIVIQSTGILRSNTLSHNNTAEGVKKSFELTRSATMSYSKAVADGLDVSANFYSKSVVN